MKRILIGIFLSGFLALLGTGTAGAQAGGHASVGLGHGEEGYLHLQEMVKHLEFSLKMEDASPELKMHGGVALKHAREALKHYSEALAHASESLGRPPGNPMAGGSGGEHSQEGGDQAPGQGGGMPEGSH